jgi:hypothetical protein
MPLSAKKQAALEEGRRATELLPFSKDAINGPVVAPISLNLFVAHGVAIAPHKSPLSLRHMKRETSAIVRVLVAVGGERVLVASGISHLLV